MAPAPQAWDSTKTFQLTSETTATVAAGSTQAALVFWIFNDKGSLLGATSMSGYYLIVEASIDGGVTWLRNGPQILNERWVEVAITGIDNTGGAITAQSTSYTAIGTGMGQLLTAIPQGCGRQITAQAVVPLGASDAGVKWRLVVDTVNPQIAASDLSNGTTGTGAVVLATSPTITSPTFAGAVAAGMSIGAVSAGGVFEVNSTTGQIDRLRNNGTTGGVDVRIIDGNGTTSSSTAIISFINDKTATRWWKVGTNGSDTLVLRDDTGGVNRLALDTSGNAGFNGASFGGGSGVRFFANATVVPSSNPTGGAIHYVEGGASKARGSSGTVTTIAAAEPHCPLCGSDVGMMESYNSERDEYLAICVPCLLRKLGLQDQGFVVYREGAAARAFREARQQSDVEAAKAARSTDIAAKMSAERAPSPRSEQDKEKATGRNASNRS